MARTAIAILCPTNDSATFRSAVAALACQSEVFAVGPEMDGVVIAMVKTEVGPLPLSRLLQRISTPEFQFEIVAYGSLVYRYGDLSIPGPQLETLIRLAESDPRFAIPERMGNGAHLRRVRQRQLG